MSLLRNTPRWALPSTVGLTLAAGLVGGPAVGFATAVSVLLLSEVRKQSHNRLPVRASALSTAAAPPFIQAAAAVNEAGPTEADVIDCATSLLQLQEAGRRITTHLDLETIVPTIVTTARSALKCRYAAVYFWNEPQQTLTASLPPRPRDARQFVPDASRGVAAWVIANRQVFTKVAFESNPGGPPFDPAGERIPAGLAPLLVGEELMGLLVVDQPERHDQSFGRMLYVLANLAALGIRNAQLFHRVQDAARRDPLTGLLNRGAFEAACAALQDSHVGRPWSLLLFDLDRFKSLNDVYGHQAGDTVLREAAALWQAALPPEAILARYGGEEFIALLPGSDRDAAADVAERLRRAVARQPFADDGRRLKVTASFGVATGIAGEEPLDVLLRQADRRLYRAKAEGRDRVALPRDRVATVTV